MRPTASLAERAALFCRANHASLRDLPKENFWRAVRALPDQVARTLASSRLTAGLVIATPAIASAATDVVTNNLDDNSMGSLRQVIADATAGDTITFSPALSDETIRLNGTTIYVYKPLTIQGPGSAHLTIDGDATGNADAGVTGGSRILYLYAALVAPPGGGPSAPQNITISGLTFQHGHTTGSGGAMSVYSVSLTLDDVVIKDSYAGVNGGGLYANGELGNTLTIRNSTISGNAAHHSGGGVGVNKPGAAVLLDNVTLSSNLSGFSGGGLYLTTGATPDVTIRNSVVDHNHSIDKGGGLRISGISDLTIEGSTIQDNAAKERGGGFLALAISHSFTLTNTTVSGNTSDNRGGGFDAYHVTGLAMSGTTVTENTTTGYGGAGMMLYKTTGSIVNSTISGNACTTTTGAGVGGGVLLYGLHNYAPTTDNRFTFTNTTIANNAGPGPGAGVYAKLLNFAPVVRNSIVALNSSTFGLDGGSAEDDLSSSGDGVTRFDVSFSLIRNTGTAAFTDAVDGGLSAAGAIQGVGNIVGVDPQLSVLADNGGPTWTHLPAATSPVVNAGDQNVDGLPPTDQRGLTRIFDGRADMGAVEVQPPPAVDGGAVTTDAGGGGGGGTTTHPDGGASKSSAKGCACSGTETDVALALLAPIGALLLRRRRARSTSA